MNIISIGRSDVNDIIINNSSVSSVHAQIEIDDHGYVFIKDENSKNGTFVNGTQIIEIHRLHTDDQVKLGNYIFNWQHALTGENPVPPSNFTAIPSTLSKGSGFIKAAVILLVAVVVTCFLFVTPFGKIAFDTIFQNDYARKSEQGQKRRIRTYDISCLNEGNGADEMIKAGSDLQDEAINATTNPFSIEDEMKVGDEVYKQTTQSYHLENDAKKKARVEGIFNRLVSTIGDSAKGFRYTIYIIESDDINAFTAGGRVFITTGIIDFSVSDGELACILGHEIYHNELGHINKALRQEAALKSIFGDEFSKFAAMATGILTASFNQKNETDCDLHGLDLAIDAGYEGCSFIPFWKRMSEKESGGETEKFFRSHPYSKQRTHCIENHFKNNYTNPCN